MWGALVSAPVFTHRVTNVTDGSLMHITQDGDIDQAEDEFIRRQSLAAIGAASCLFLARQSVARGIRGNEGAVEITLLAELGRLGSERAVLCEFSVRVEAESAIEPAAQACIVVKDADDTDAVLPDHLEDLVHLIALGTLPLLLAQGLDQGTGHSKGAARCKDQEVELLAAKSPLTRMWIVQRLSPI